MPALDETPSARPERAFSIGLYVVIILGVAEILLGLTHLVRRGRRSATSTTAAGPSAPVVTPTPAAPPGSATPAAQVQSSAAPISADERLLKEAQALNDRGDTANALARLQEGVQRDPHSAALLAQLAAIYESIQLFDRSNETWRKIEALGPGAGEFYELAEAKLKNGAAAPTEAATPPLDRDGLPEGATFGINEITSESIADPDAETNFRLKILVRKRDGVPIELSKLKIIVRFYDLIDDERIVDTDADVSYEWFNPKHDWSETNPEMLVVSYVRAKNHAISSDAAISAAAAAVTPGKPARSKKRSEPSAGGPVETARRKYFGYVVRISYDDKLQTVRADPARLLNDAPNSP